MKLVSVQVRNYKSVEDSTSFAVGKMTCLAGKNEAGKSAILQALRRLNPVEDEESNFSDLMEYPRRRRFDLDRGGEFAIVLDTIWRLEDDDVTAAAELFGPGVLTHQDISIQKGYNNRRNWSIDINESMAVRHIIGDVTNLTGNVSTRLQSCETINALRTALEDHELTDGERDISERLAERYPDSASAAVRLFLRDRLPRFLYFPTYAILEGKISLDRLQQVIDDPGRQSASERLFAALLALADTDPRSLASIRRSEELQAQLEIVSNRVSDEIFRYWSQNRNLEVQFGFRPGLPDDPEPYNTGRVVDLRVRNTRHRVSVGFDERSTGFVWFFSFLVMLSQMQDRYGERLVILLDEPGLSLHGKAQQDLLRYMKERLLPTYQVIYTTHSPFMIDAEDLLSVRMIEDQVGDQGEILGTKVSERVLSADGDTILPLRAALGYDITQALFVGEYSLLVEGPSDLLYLQWASRRAEAMGLEALDRRWTITPVGGIDKVASFAALFAGNLLNVAILVDYKTGDKRKVKALEEMEMVAEGCVFTASAFVDSDEADTEDLLGEGVYKKLINKVYGLKKRERLTPSEGGISKGPIVEEVKKHFQTIATSGPYFDHLTPATYLFSHDGDFDDVQGLREAIERFSRFFEAVNRLLPPNG